MSHAHPPPTRWATIKKVLGYAALLLLGLAIGSGTHVF